MYLAVEGGTHSRDKLAAIFWPESDTERSRGALRTALAYLRNTLRMPDNAKNGLTPHLIIEHDTLAFDFNSEYSLDASLLQEAYNLLRQSSSDLHDTITKLQKAVNAYRGDFLDGFSLNDSPSFDDWVSNRREIITNG